MAAARHWAIGGNDPERRAALLDAQALLANMREWKAGPEVTAPVEAEIERLSAETDCPVHADNWDTVLTFAALDTQWRWVAGLGGALRVGLDYPAVESVLRLRGVRGQRAAAMFGDLQLMELAALTAWREQRDTQAKVQAQVTQ